MVNRQYRVFQSISNFINSPRLYRTGVLTVRCIVSINQLRPSQAFDRTVGTPLDANSNYLVSTKLL